MTFQARTILFFALAVAGPAFAQTGTQEEVASQY